MYNSPTLLQGLSLTKVISGLSKTLQIANQVIPLYYKAKPIITNTKSVLKTLKNTTNQEPKIIKTTNIQNKETKKEINNLNTPKFFL